MAMLEAKLGKQVPAGRPDLRVVPTPPIGDMGMDSATRESYLRVIRGLSRAYQKSGLHLIVNRATLGKGTIDQLSDEEIVALHRDLHRGLDCMRNDVPFEHAGLIDEGDICASVA